MADDWLARHWDEGKQAYVFQMARGRVWIDWESGERFWLPEEKMIRAALDFYKRSPDGQYDSEVVVPILKWLLETRVTEKVTGD